MTSAAIAPDTMDALMRTCARIGDLGYLLDKDDYLELFRRFFRIGREADICHVVTEPGDSARHGCARTVRTLKEMRCGCRCVARIPRSHSTTHRMAGIST